MSSPLDSTFGFWLVSIWLQTFLQGCGMLQTWLYFHWYHNDSWGIKAMVYALLVIETFQIIVFFQITYVYLIDGFGNVPRLFLIHWQDSAQLFATYLSAFTVQMYFGYCIYVLDRQNMVIPGIIAVLALTQIGSGLAQTIITIRLTSFSQLGSTKAITTLEAASALLCDSMITVSLVRNLGKHKGHVKSTNTLLTTLMVNAVNRGILTALCALLNLILFLALPGTFYFFIGLELSGKLYMNSALATLNSRQHIMKKAHGGSQGSLYWNSIPMSNTGVAAPTSTVNEERHVRVIVTKQSDTDQGQTEYKNSTFMDGML